MVANRTVGLVTVSALATFVATWSCGGGFAPLLVSEPTAPPAIREACRLTAQRCSRCHGLERITRSAIVDPRTWQTYVRRMRLMPGSGIPPAEEPALTQCLVYRVDGLDGLARLAGTAGSP